jgi:hypothetical protein
MKKITVVLLGFLLAVCLFHGNVFAAPAGNSAEASTEVSKALVEETEAVAEEAAPMDEELRDEEVVDSDA